MATKSIAWQTGSGNITLTYQGQGDGTIQVDSDPNSLGSARSQVITIETTAGTPVVTKNVTVSQAACPFPVGKVKSFDYTGSVQNVLLPAGQYKLQCWGAQGGNVSGSYTAVGSKGGYSEGVLTLSSPTTVYVFVGGKGTNISTSTTTSGVVNGGWNGGGGSIRFSRVYNTTGGYTVGQSYPRGGGGATDIALVTSSMSYSDGVTNRSSASLLSRIIVAGGGGGASANYYEYEEQETQTTESISKSSYTGDTNGISYASKTWNSATSGAWSGHIINVTSHRGESCTFTGGSAGMTFVKSTPITGGSVDYASGYGSTGYNDAAGTVTVPSDAVYLWVQCYGSSTSNDRRPSIEFTKVVTVTKSGSNVSFGAAYGGGTSGGAYCGGKQDSSGVGGGSFGKGKTNTDTNSAFHTGGGGGGWYGGGANGSGNYPSIYVDNGGGGSGFVNTYANRNYRPSGYTGLQLDSGETKAGNTSFPSTSGGNETGHSGNGYARITRLS